VPRKQDWTPREDAESREERDRERSYREWMRAHGITMEAERAAGNPFVPRGWDRDLIHWKITLHKGRETFVTYFSQGARYREAPASHQVLGTLASTAADVLQDFEGWASIYGYDLASREAHETWEALVRDAKRLKRFLGADLFRQLLSL